MFGVHKALESWAVLVQSDGSNNALSLVVNGDIAYKYIKNTRQLYIYTRHTITFTTELKSQSSTTQIAFRRRTDVGYWSHGRQILPTLGRRWADVGLPTNTPVTQIACRRRTDVGCLSQGRQILPTLGRRWPNGCLPTPTLVVYLYSLPTLGQRWIFIQDGGEQ